MRCRSDTLRSCIPVRVPSSFREPTAMGLWEKSHRIFKCLCDHGRQGGRRIAQQTGLSTSSVHRLTQATERRKSHPESWVWETADSRQWLRRLVVATLSPFGLKRGGAGHAARVLHASPSGHAGGMFAFGFTRCHAHRGDRAAGDRGGLGAGRVCGGCGPRDHWRGG
jgi:hypothetical protein